MAIRAGLVGLPNVGKSTLFNALTKSAIAAENYPFCTLDANVAITNVPDDRLDKLAHIFGSKKIIPATVQFVDIAGLVKGAAKGEGLGNQFLGNILDVDLILHVLRCFEDDDITHVHGSINPFEDFETITLELMLKDLESVAKRVERVQGFLKTAKNKQATTLQIATWEKELSFLERVRSVLLEGDVYNIQAKIWACNTDNIDSIPLLCAKKILIVANVSEDDYVGQAYKNTTYYKSLIDKFGNDRVIVASAKIESELAQLDSNDAIEMMESLDLTEKGLDSIIKKAYANLGLLTFFTCGPKEAHAWSILQGSKAPDAAGAIHSDLQRGFICAEVYHCKDLFAAKSEAELKKLGKVKTEGKEYVVQDGDVILIRFNV